MIHDYYLSKAERYIDTQIAKNKKEILDSVINDRKPKGPKDIHIFYPKAEDLKDLPENSTLIKISFTLKKPYTSRDEGEFHIIDDIIFVNPIVRDKFTGLPMVRPSTWKGHLRFASGKVDEINGKKLDERIRGEIVRRLFGSESDDENALKGMLHFFPTFFEEEPKRDVITPLKRDTRTPTKGRSPIPIEVMKSRAKGEFYLLYIPYPKGKNFKEEEVKEDLKFLAEALKLMFYTYGFSAKKTSGFGVIEKLKNEDVEILPEGKKDIFSILYTKIKNNGNQGA